MSMLVLIIYLKNVENQQFSTIFHRTLIRFPFWSIKERISIKFRQSEKDALQNLIFLKKQNLNLENLWNFCDFR